MKKNSVVISFCCILNTMLALQCGPFKLNNFFHFNFCCVTAAFRVFFFFFITFIFANGCESMVNLFPNKYKIIYIINTRRYGLINVFLYVVSEWFFFFFGSEKFKMSKSKLSENWMFTWKWAENIFWSMGKIKFISFTWIHFDCLIKKSINRNHIAKKKKRMNA